MSLRLHPEHGINPSLEVCFWCGEARGVALLGYNRGKEAPRSTVVDYEPCDGCKEHWGRGVVLIEAARTPIHEGQPPLQKGAYPTGQWTVIKTEAVSRIFKAPTADAILTARKAFMEPEQYQALLNSAPKSEGGSDGK